MQASHERSAAIEKAARIMARGELDAALRLYLQIFDNDPHDWSVGNTVGDLYVRLGKADDAVSHFTMLAEQLMADGFAAKARALYRKILRLQPANDEARRRVEELERQQATTTSPFLQRVLETARTQRQVEAAAKPAAVPQPQPTPAEAPAPAVSAATPGVEAEAGAEVDATVELFQQMQTAADSALQRGDHRAAAAIVERFLSDRPDHVLALERLVDISVEGQFDRELVAAQRRLADACVKSGHYRQAFDIAVDLCEREPLDKHHREQLDRIAAIARAQGRTFAPLPTPEPEAGPEPVAIVVPAGPRLVPPPVTSAPAPPPPVVTHAPAAPVVTAAPASAPAAATGGSIAIGPPFGDLLKAWSDPERPLDEIRSGLLEDAAAAAEEGFAQAARMIEARQFTDAERALEDAMCLPHLRVPAGARLAQAHRGSGAPEEALAVLEWVAGMPPADEDSGHELAYELALTLEALGQDAQALGVYRELLAEVGPGYRDVSTRARRLAAA